MRKMAVHPALFVCHYDLCLLLLLFVGSSLPYADAFLTQRGVLPRWEPSPSNLFRERGRKYYPLWTRTMALEASRRESIRTMILETTPVLLSLSTWQAPAAATANEALPASQVEEKIVLQGRVLVAPDLDTSSSNSALYITCRPDKPDNVPAAILNGSRGKSPPVLSARLPNPTFPLDFQLVLPRDLTLEGAWDGKTPLPSGNTPIQTEVPNNLDELWWKETDLIVSARWDNDGVAATRSPDDLVGRGLWKASKGNGKDDDNSVVEIQLTGRGAFGKFATGGKKT
jgi:hypothetical protein